MGRSEITKARQWLSTGSVNIFGLPFSGKDTQGMRLAELFEAEFISGGDILRKTGQQHVKDSIAAGNLAPTKEYLETILPYFSRKEFANKALILSSVGRWDGEEESVVQAARQSGHPIKAVIFLSITEAEAEKRWHTAERGRDDDTAHHTLLKRFEEFRTKTLPVIAYYRKQKLLIEVDGMLDIDEITDRIVGTLAARADTDK